MAATMQALAAKPFVGQDIKLRARSTSVAAVRAPLTVRASQQEQEAVGAPILHGFLIPPPLVVCHFSRACAHSPHIAQTRTG